MIQVFGWLLLLGRSEGNATLAWGTTSWPAVTRGRLWRRAPRPATPACPPWRGTRWASRTLSSAGPPGHGLLPAGPGLSQPAEESVCPRDAGQHAGRVRRCLPGRPDLLG